MRTMDRIVLCGKALQIGTVSSKRLLLVPRKQNLRWIYSPDPSGGWIAYALLLLPCVTFPTIPTKHTASLKFNGSRLTAMFYDLRGNCTLH